MSVSQKVVEDDVFIPPEETELNFTYYDREIRATEHHQRVTITKQQKKIQLAKSLSTEPLEFDSEIIIEEFELNEEIKKPKKSIVNAPSFGKAESPIIIQPKGKPVTAKSEKTVSKIKGQE